MDQQPYESEGYSENGDKVALAAFSISVELLTEEEEGSDFATFPLTLYSPPTCMAIRPEGPSDPGNKLSQGWKELLGGGECRTDKWSLCTQITGSNPIHSSSSTCSFQSSLYKPLAELNLLKA